VKKKKKNNLTHRDACFSLAEAKATRYIEVPLGSVWLNRGSLGQADVITVKPSYNRFNLDIYEVKVTRSDFLQDIKRGKYKKYLPFCNRLYFAVLDGIAEKDEIPEGIGLIKYGEKGWYTVKAAKKREIEYMEQMLMALAFSNGRIYQQRRIDLSRNYYGVSTIQKSNLKGFGKKIKEMILNYNNLRLKFDNLLYDASKKIPFKSEEERENFIEKWEKRSYIRDW
jgi:hypothetical protein